jgi:hypothetical protein
MENPKLAADSPLSRRIGVTEIPSEGLDVTIKATPEERGALARQNGLAGVSSLEATLHVARSGAEGVYVSGELRASLSQTCVVTLDDFDTDIVEPIHARFASLHDLNSGTSRLREAAETETSGHHIHSLDEEDPPEPLIGGEVDLGALAAEFLTLALDPYPRKPGVAFTEPHPAEAEPSESPFSKLRDLAPKAEKRCKP